MAFAGCISLIKVSILAQKVAFGIGVFIRSPFNKIVPLSPLLIKVSMPILNVKSKHIYRHESIPALMKRNSFIYRTQRFTVFLKRAINKTLIPITFLISSSNRHRHASSFLNFLKFTKCEKINSKNFLNLLKNKTTINEICTQNTFHSISSSSKK